MFSDKDSLAAVGFASDWRKTLSLKENGCQTDELGTKEVEAQTKTFEEVDVQTEDTRTTGEKLEAAEKQLNNPSLVKFLVKATPLLERELDAALRSRAFDGYSLLDDGEDEHTVRKLHTLDHGNSSFRVSAVTWNSSGAVVAVAYESASDHEQWCSHDTSLAVWNVGRRDFDPGSPHQLITVDTCLTQAKFHPRDPAYILAGGFSGNVYIWSAAKMGLEEDPLVASSSQQMHREKITALQWVVASDAADSTLRSTKVLSGALDGKMILWSVDSTSQTLRPFRAFLLQAEHLPRSLRIRARSQTEVGLTCAAINCEDGDIVMIGTEAGVIFQGSLSSEVPAAATATTTEEISWLDPVVVAFAPHRGRVVDLKCSPFHRDVFLSLGSDQEIRIYSLLSPHTPAHVIHQEDSGLSALDWSPARPLAIAAAAANSCLKLFDLKSGSQVSLRASEKLIPFPLTSVAFNVKDRSLLATGDGFGRVHVWRLSSEYSSGAGANEVKGLQALVDRAAGEE